MRRFAAVLLCATTTLATCDVLAFDFAAHGMLDTGLFACADIGGFCPGECSPEGYVMSWMGPPEVRCTAAGWEVVNPCQGPVVCGDYECPIGFKSDDPWSTYCLEIEETPTGPICAKGINDMCCLTAAPCPLHALSIGRCTCMDGYIGSPAWDPPNWTHTCNATTCAPYTLSPGEVGTDGTPCTEGIVLSHEEACSFTCTEGYSNRTGQVACSFSIFQKLAHCTENSCSAYILPVGVTAPLPDGSSPPPCGNTTSLTAVVFPECRLQCAEGYVGSPGTLQCLAETEDDAPPIANITCTPTCATHLCNDSVALPASIVCGDVCSDELCCGDVPAGATDSLQLVYIIVPVAAVFLIVLCALLLITRRSARHDLEEELLQEMVAVSSESSLRSLPKIASMALTCEELIGRGACSTVYRARASEGEVVAVKVIPLGGAEGEGLKEVAVLEQIQHEHLVAYHGSLVQDGALYIAMEYLPRGALSELVEREGMLRPGETRRYTRQLVSAVRYLHKLRIMHRDIKGANILLTEGNEGVKLADLGCAKIQADVTQTLEGKAETVVGTPRWMAPEVIQSTEAGYSAKADVWSIGCTVCEMLTGEPPWPCMASLWATMYHIANNEPDIPLFISSDAADFVTLLLTKDPGARPSADDVAAHPWLAEDAP